ncbi:MAG: type II toxin-antitoxin system death-on-curing family toxin [Clostridiales bacterium]|nr:type II toxin-antitoxin system death-on-curing family toxin [Candidatus Equinaster intestinalis]
MLSFLELNGIKLGASSDDVVKLGLSVADGSFNKDDILKWILEHKA